jgi:hypothetical protein
LDTNTGKLDLLKPSQHRLFFISCDSSCSMSIGRWGGILVGCNKGGGMGGGRKGGAMKFS